MKQNWIKARKSLLQRVKQLVKNQVASSEDLEKLQMQYDLEFSGRWSVSRLAELLESVRSAHIVLGGDFHAYEQSQRTHLRILRSGLLNKTVVIALECVCHSDQSVLDAFVSGLISEEEFLQKVAWSKKWGFPWKHYEPLFRLAKEQKWKVLALNRSAQRHQKIETREILAAKLIARERKRNPEALLYVVFGDFHLSSGQLPKHLERELARVRMASKTVVIHQDSDQLYFQLARRQQEMKVQVLRKASSYCVLTSPPWLKWQSYYFFLENQGDLTLRTNEVDWTDHVRELIALVSADLDLTFKGDDFSVYLFGDVGAWNILKSSLPKRWLPSARWLSRQGFSFFVPSKGLYLLSHPTVNHASSLIADYLQCKLTGRKKPLWDFPRDFNALIWVETLGFFVSKLINHRRKPNPIESLMQSQHDSSKDVLFLILEQNLDFLRWGEGMERRPTRFRPRLKTSYFAAARLLGSLLGERMYALYRSGKIDSKRVVDWLAKDTSDKDFEEFYAYSVRRLKYVPRWAVSQDL